MRPRYPMTRIGWRDVGTKTWTKDVSVNRGDGG
jgi:hypothetical protein